MSRPPKKMTMEERIMFRFAPGCAYAAWEAGNILGMNVATVRPILEAMVKDGLLVTRVMPDRHRRFILAGTEGMKSNQKLDDPRVAKPLVKVLMTGEFHGFDRDWKRFREMCMGARRN